MKPKNNKKAEYKCDRPDCNKFTSNPSGYCSDFCEERSRVSRCLDVQVCDECQQGGCDRFDLRLYAHMS